MKNIKNPEKSFSSHNMQSKGSQNKDMFYAKDFMRMSSTLHYIIGLK
jgi:hypothetical protein